MTSRVMPPPPVGPEATPTPAGLLQIHPLDGNQAGLRLVGEADIATRPILTAGLAALARATEPEQVHLDLSGLAFLDVAGARALIRTAEHIHEQGGGQLVLHHPASIVVRLLGLLTNDQLRPAADNTLTLPPRPKTAQP